MKAIRLTRTGGPEVLELADLPVPRPGEGEALVRVEAAGVNFIDVYHRAGAYARPLPFVLGEEGAGVVESVGEGVGDLSAGDRVAWAGVSGSYSAHVVALADRLVRVPEGVAADRIRGYFRASGLRLSTAAAGRESFGRTGWVLSSGTRPSSQNWGGLLGVSQVTAAARAAAGWLR